ncbi:MAG: hypothetical protein GF410_07115 [Chitinivibrionales bacterium]|nr:hypothetical protein [Chitinivibrionales bacterium]
MRHAVAGRILCAFLLAPGLLWAGEAEKVARTIESYLNGLEKDLIALAGRREMLVRKVTLADIPIGQTMEKRPELITVMRVNSRGLVVNEKHTNREPGREFRNLSNQKWFRETSDLKRYYGHLTTSTARHRLFWCVPIKVQKRSGPYRSGGAIVTKIDLRTALENAAKEIRQPFLVFHGRRRIFSHAWKDKELPGASEELTIKGMDNLRVSVSKTREAAHLDDAGPASGGDKGAPAADAEMKAPGVPQPGADGGEVTRKKGELPLMLILGIVAAGIVLAGLAALFQRLTSKRHKALVEEIDKESSPFEYGETVVMDRSKLMQHMQAEGAGQPAVSPAEPAAPAAAEAGRAQAAQPAPSRPRDPFKETRIMSLDQMRAEVEADINQKLNAVLSERTKQIRKEAYGQVRLTFLKNMKSYSVALGAQIDKLYGLMQAVGARDPQQAHMLQGIVGELQKIRDSIEGKPGQ